MQLKFSVDVLHLPLVGRVIELHFLVDGEPGSPDLLFLRFVGHLGESFHALGGQLVAYLLVVTCSRRGIAFMKPRLQFLVVQLNDPPELRLHFRVSLLHPTRVLVSGSRRGFGLGILGNIGTGAGFRQLRAQLLDRSPDLVEALV